jgi:hypothetical protein
VHHLSHPIYTPLTPDRKPPLHEIVRMTGIFNFLHFTKTSSTSRTFVKLYKLNEVSPGSSSRSPYGKWSWTLWLRVVYYESIKTDPKNLGKNVFCSFLFFHFFVPVVDQPTNSNVERQPTSSGLLRRQRDPVRDSSQRDPVRDSGRVLKSKWHIPGSWWYEHETKTVYKVCDCTFSR